MAIQVIEFMSRKGERRTDLAKMNEWLKLNSPKVISITVLDESDSFYRNYSILYMTTLI